MLASYRSHDEGTMSYMRQAIERIDEFKYVFEKYRPTVAITQKGGNDEREAQFNIPKLHVTLRTVHSTVWMRALF